MSEDIQQNEKAMPDEQASALASLQAKAAEQGHTGAPVTEPEPTAPVMPLAEQISGMLAMAVGVVAPMFPSLEAIYTPEVVERVGVALQPVCDKHGWLQDGIGGKYGEELMALAVVGPLAYATYGAISNDIASRKARELEKLPVGPENTIAATVPLDTGPAVSMGKVIPHENG